MPMGGKPTDGGPGPVVKDGQVLESSSPAFPPPTPESALRVENRRLRLALRVVLRHVEVAPVSASTLRWARHVAEESV